METGSDERGKAPDEVAMIEFGNRNNVTEQSNEDEVKFIRSTTAGGKADADEKGKRIAIFVCIVMTTLLIIVILVFTLTGPFLTGNTRTDGSPVVCVECNRNHSSNSGNLVNTGTTISSPTSSLKVTSNPLPETTSIGASNESTTDVIAPWEHIRLSKHIKALGYILKLKIDLKSKIIQRCPFNKSFSGNVTMVIFVKNSTRHVLFHANMLDIHPETIQVKRQNTSDFFVIESQFYHHITEFYVLKMSAELIRGFYEVQIGHFAGCILNDLQGLYLSDYKNSSGDTRYLAASQLQSTDARKVFPCFDEPDMKATFAVTITHQSEYHALSNMPVEDKSCIGNCDWITVKFQTTPIMSTYLLAFVVSDFVYKEKILPGDYTLRMWSQPDMINQTTYALDFAASSYAFFTDYFQIADIVPKSDHVAVPDFSGGAMENWGLVIYRETALLYDPDVSSSSNKFLVTLIVAHEVSHTWFGNMVTMKWWDDLWLNEGFASILMYFAMDHVNPEWNVFDIVVVEYVFPVMVKDALETSHPISLKISHPDEIAGSFDQISYNKGMAVLRMLHGFLGWEGFRRGLQVYVATYQFKNAEMSELWQTFTESTNNTFNIGEIMDTWTRQMGYPVISVTTQDDHYILNQTRFLINKKVSSGEGESPFGYKWHVPFTYQLEGDTETHLHWLNMGSSKLPKTSDGWLIGNINYGGFYRVNYDATIWQKLTEQLNTDHRVFPSGNRAGLIGDAFNLARASDLDYAVALNLTTYLHNEDDYVPWKAFLDALEFLRGMLSKQSAYVLLEKHIRDLVAPVFAKIGTKETGTLPEIYLRRLLLETGCNVGVKDAITYAKEKFHQWMINGTRLPTEYSHVIYAVGVREGSVEEWDFVWTKSQESKVASEREIMLEALAHTQKPWLLWRYANWIFDVDKIKMQDVHLVTNYFSNRPLGRMIALHFLMNRWDELNERYGEDTFIIREMIADVTAYVNSDFELRQLELLFNEKPPKAAKKAADNALALIRANINWMQENYKTIASWLDEKVESSF